MIKVSAPSDHPYGNVIESFFAQQFPGANTNKTSTLLDALTTAIVGSSQVRYGAMPSPESLTAIRRVITESNRQDKPIPILVPFGSRKAVLGEPLDIAEVAALKQLMALQQRVQEHYKPGVGLRMGRLLL